MSRRRRPSGVVLAAMAVAIVLVAIVLSRPHGRMTGGGATTGVESGLAPGVPGGVEVVTSTSTPTVPDTTTVAPTPGRISTVTSVDATASTAAPAPTATATPPPPSDRPPVVPVNQLNVPPVSVQPVVPRPLPGSPEAIAAAVMPAVVDIESRLPAQGLIAAGTGMVLRASGVVLTNNHVIHGATSIVATEVTSGQRYQAEVIGVDPTADIAVLQLQSASGLPTITVGPSSGVTPGEPVVAIGNAGGAGGTPAVTSGTVEATGQSIAATDPIFGMTEHLTGLVETNARSVPGDSGGPLVDGSGAVIGMVTAGAVANASTSAIDVSFAIPADQAVAGANQMAAGQASATVLLGRPGSLGVGIGATGASGAVVATVVAGSPADSAGLAVGDTLSSVGVLAVTSAQALDAAMKQYRQGTLVTVAWVDRRGTRHRAPVTLAGGPAD